VTCAQERWALPNGRLINFSVDRELCVLPSGVNSLCNWHCHQKSILLYYYTANILVWLDRQATERYGRPFGWADNWMDGCRWPGHRALRYYLTSTSMGNKDLGERCLHGTGICSQHYHLFLWQWIAICDPWRSGCWITIHDTRSENHNINRMVYSCNT